MVNVEDLFKWREEENHSGLPLYILKLPYAEARIGTCDFCVEKVFYVYYHNKGFLVDEIRYGLPVDTLKAEAERIITKNLQSDLLTLRQII